MIEEIRLEGVGVISAAHVPLRGGLTVVTGETGAGKTMLLTGISLLLGGRADPAAVRTGSPQATVEGCFVVDPAGEVAARVGEAGGAVDEDGSLLVVRTVPAQGRSRAFLGGRSVPQALLAELADRLVTVHGQADQMRLRAPARQREAVDDFAGAAHLARVSRHRELWSQRRALLAELEDLERTAEDRAREAASLRAGLEELERVDPRPGEEAELQAQVERLTHVEELRSAVATAYDAVVGADGADAAGTPGGAQSAVDQARRALDQVVGLDAALEGVLTRTTEVGYLLADLSAELAGYVDDLEADPARLDAVHARLAELQAVARTHGTSVDGTLAWAEEASRRLLAIDGSGDRRDELKERLAGVESELDDLADVLSGERRVAAERLAAAVTRELEGLAMAGARLEVRLQPGDHGPAGRDDVALLLEPHSGAPARPLAQGASGGELSRVMLAVEVALATAPESGAHRPPTFVFDEVDAGVGGRAAVEVGRRLAGLARTAQVLVVTHLPQVAAFADHHLVVRKSGQAGAEEVTVSDVRAVTGDERVAELARMLSGAEDSATALEHAAELLERSTVGR